MFSIFKQDDPPTPSALRHIILCIILYFSTVYAEFNLKRIWYCFYVNFLIWPHLIPDHVTCISINCLLCNWKQTFWNFYFETDIINQITKFWLDIFSSSCPKVFYKKGFLKNFAKFTGGLLCRSLFFNKTANWSPASFLKRDSGTGVILWIWWNYLDCLYCRTSVKGCFYVLYSSHSSEKDLGLIQAVVRRCSYQNRCS